MDADTRIEDADWDVPAFDVDELDRRRSDHAVCVFVLNEDGRLHSQLERMRPHVEAVDVIIADGGSTDGSTELDRLRPFGVNALLTKRGPGKLSAQMRMALAFCLRRGYEGVVVIDGNNKDDPSAIPTFLEALRGGCDHAQGSRFIAGGRGINTPMARLLGVRLLHAPLISLASGFRYTDTTNGFRAYSRQMLLDRRVAPFRPVFERYELHYYLAIRAARLGFDVRELPVTRAYPKSGKTPTKIRGWRGNALVLRTLFAACAGRFDPPVESPRAGREGADGQRLDRAHRVRGGQPRPPASVR